MLNGKYQSNRKDTEMSGYHLLPLMSFAMLMFNFVTHAEQGVKTLLLIPVSQENLRNSEGDIIELKDGQLCYVYSRFKNLGGIDHSQADLAMRTSADQGCTWSEDRILVPNEGKCNTMSVSILRLKNGGLLLFYLRKDSPMYDCNLFVRRSSDEFKTLSDPVRVTLLDGYHVVNNDRVIQLSSGRIIAPAVIHTEFDETGKKVIKGPVEEVDYSKFIFQGVPLIYYSDDNGRTWQKDNTIVIPASQRTITDPENGVVELKDGRLWMYMRTAHGFQYGCYSTDGGLNWSQPKPTSLASPCSPATIERIPWTGDLLCIWNDHSGLHSFTPNQRNPLCAAISKDDGLTWTPSKIIENNPNYDYCYTSITFLSDRVILSYDEGYGVKIVAISRDWLYSADSADTH